MRAGIAMAGALLLAQLASADCSAPQPPQTLPDGNRADKATMLAAHRDVRAFVESADAYLNCLDAQERAAQQAGSETAQSRRQRIQAYNTTVAQMQNLSARLKEEIEKFNAR